MDDSVASSLAKTGQALANKAADKAQGVIRIGQDTANDVGNILSSKLEDVRSEAGTAVNRGSKRAQAAGRQDLDAITDVVTQACDTVSNASSSIVAYTKKNPAKALAIATASGALLYAATKALRSYRD